MPPPTLILRHRKENLKKCSLKGLESNPNFFFYRYPLKHPLPFLGNYILLTPDAPLLRGSDSDSGILLIDGTWAGAEKMLKIIPESVPRRSLPPSIQTAYPRRQSCKTGLASIEALFTAFTILGRDTEGLLDHYYWRDPFLEKNRSSPIVVP